MAKLTLNEFIDRANKIHNFKYDYKNTIYTNSLIKLDFICPIHDCIVQMTPGNHLAGKGCRKCAYESSSLKNSKTKEKVIEDANIAHNFFYNYDLIEYSNAKKKIEIICPKHGKFWQTPDTHLRPSVCPKCKYEKIGAFNALTNEEFIQRAKLKHGDKYDYSLVDYKNEDTDLIIICPTHGDFVQKGANHLKSRGCQKCGNENTSKYQKENPNGWGLDTWVNKAKNSKFFDSFKFYLIECYNDNERFYKLGRTFTIVKYRFRYKTQLPYKYKIIKEIIGTAEEIIKLELDMKRLNKLYKYRPKLEFGGQHECYFKINLKDAEYI